MNCDFVLFIYNLHDITKLKKNSGDFGLMYLAEVAGEDLEVLAVYRDTQDMHIF